ncbi:MAG: hypothetical protein LAT68_03085 [Cyclobacteriaceae bacterium]|nr:oligosaccharide repeat unit polymerase [Cyclobacteriaceae bacterium]MCH8515291.1 hypothetical protein [Cyclobacteriaceae bacterium]
MKLLLTLDKYRFLVFFIILVFLLPTFPTLTRSSAGRIGDIFLVLIMVGLSFLYLLFFNPKLQKGKVMGALIIFCTFLILISLSIFIEFEFIIVRDLFEFHKPIFILLIFFMILSLDWSDDTVNNYFIKAFKFIFIFNIVYALIEAYTGNFGNILSTFLYKNDRSILYGKATGTFGITYFFAAFMIMPTFFYLFKFLFERKSVDLILFLLSFFCIVSSQSRTVFLATAFGFVYLFFIYWSFKDFPLKKTIYTTVFTFIGTIAIFFQSILEFLSGKFPYLVLGISKLIENRGVSSSGEGSANIRYQQVLWAWENQAEIPIFGAGIGKGSGPMLESFYALYLYRYGMIGILIAIILLILNYFLSLRSFRIALENGKIDNASFFLAFSVFCFILPITSVASVITDQPKHAVLYYGLLAVMLKYTDLYSRKKYEKSSSPQ